MCVFEGEERFWRCRCEFGFGDGFEGGGLSLSVWFEGCVGLWLV